MLPLNTLQFLIILLFLSILYVLEQHYPQYGRRSYWHSLNNIGIGVINAAVGFLFLLPLVYVTTWEFGLLHQLNYSILTETIIAFVLFDLWMYIWHVMNHKIHFLWEFHKAHHSDTDMDASTALRFHPGEIFLSTTIRLFILPLLGMQLWQLLLYEVILFPIILFHHSNVTFSGKIDRYYRLLFVSPYVHWVHHSQKREETDSNYGSIFSFWDRIFSTLRIREHPESIVQGLETYRTKKWQNIKGILQTPFK